MHDLWIGQTFELRLDLILPKEVRRQSIARLGPNHLHDLWIGQTFELRLDLILPKEVRRQSVKGSVPSTQMT
jgi:hypothetical protein